MFPKFRLDTAGHRFMRELKNWTCSNRSFYPFFNLNTKLCLSYDRVDVGRKKSANFGILGFFEEWSYLDFCFLQLLTNISTISSVLYKFCLCYLDKFVLLSVWAEARVAAECSHAPCSSPWPATSPARHSSRGFCLHQTIEYGELLSNSATRTQQIVLIFQRTQTDCLFKPLQLDAFIFILSRNKRRIFNKH